MRTKAGGETHAPSFLQSEVGCNCNNRSQPPGPTRCAASLAFRLTPRRPARECLARPKCSSVPTQYRTNIQPRVRLNTHTQWPWAVGHPDDNRSSHNAQVAWTKSACVGAKNLARAWPDWLVCQVGQNKRPVGCIARLPGWESKRGCQVVFF